MDNEAAKPQCSEIDFYSCEEAIKRLHEYLDQQLSEEERIVVLKHLDICKPCFSRFTFEQTLIISLRAKVTCVHTPDPLKEKLKALLRMME